MNELTPPLPLAQVINGTHTDIVVQVFRDRIFVVVTQLARMGTLLFASQEENSMGEKDYTVNILMGRRDDPLLTIYARQLVEQIGKSSDLPLLLAITLKDEGRDSATFQEVVNLVLRLKCW